VLAWWQAVVLGLVEGITEYLPVSSTGHLILTAALLRLDRPETKEALDAYLVVMQGGAILAVVLLYWPRVLQMARGLVGRDPGGARLARNVGLAFVPAVVAGVVLNKVVKATLFSAWPVLAALAAGGVWMVWLGRRDSGAAGDVTAMSWRTALGIGLFQVLALWPGTSRSMVTIGGGMMLGLRATAAAEFSFLLGLPTLGAACVHDLAGSGTSMVDELGAGAMALGFVVATVAAAVAVRWLVRFLTRHGLAPFGWYRLVLSAVLAALIVSGAVHVG
jgi:undecaprenyl-diphosphatase